MGSDTHSLTLGLTTRLALANGVSEQRHGRFYVSLGGPSCAVVSCCEKNMSQ